jgi:hypothetical protein
MNKPSFRSRLDDGLFALLIGVGSIGAAAMEIEALRGAAAHAVAPPKLPRADPPVTSISAVAAASSVGAATLIAAEQGARR